ncbi:hypothetical protein [Neorhizobium tomejilense]|uniref:hypothetical protein n=1 Tax=Neorhizobium tomejilense TaxID=2093828 RepID=UPI00155E333C|nr:hypothetical protein [Neorhizobium tomejilense]
MLVVSFSLPILLAKLFSFSWPEGGFELDGLNGLTLWRIQGQHQDSCCTTLVQLFRASITSFPPMLRQGFGLYRNALHDYGAGAGAGKQVA